MTITSTPEATKCPVCSGSGRKSNNRRCNCCHGSGVAPNTAKPEPEGILTIDVIEDSYSWNVHFLGEMRWMFPKTFPSPEARANAFAEGARAVFRLQLPNTEVEIMRYEDGEGPQ